MRVKMSTQPQPAPIASAIGPYPTLIQTSRTPRHWKVTQDHRTTRPPQKCYLKRPLRLVGWLFGFNGPLRQYFGLNRAVSQREGERGENRQMRVKMSKQPPPAPTASAVGPCPTVIQIVGRPGPGLVGWLFWA